MTFIAHSEKELQFPRMEVTLKLKYFCPYLHLGQGPMCECKVHIQLQAYIKT
jgi:hypothetical protein